MRRANRPLPLRWERCDAIFAPPATYQFKRERRPTRVLTCARCGREQSTAERFCTACGEASSHLMASGAGRAGSSPSPASDGSRDEVACASCATIRTGRSDTYCSNCGAPFPTTQGRRGWTAPRGMRRVAGPPTIAVLDAAGAVTRILTLEKERALLSHELLGLEHTTELPGGGAQFSLDEDGLRLEPLQAHHSIFIFISAPSLLNDGDVFLLGSQIIRYRDLEGDDGLYFGANAAEPLGSMVPGADAAVLEQLRADGRVRDVLHLWRGRDVQIGRDSGDWVFPWDPTVSARHAEVRCDVSGRVTLRDLGSTNGVAIRARGPRLLTHGQRLSLGGRVLRVEST